MILFLNKKNLNIYDFKFKKYKIQYLLIVNILSLLKLFKYHSLLKLIYHYF